MSHFGFSPMFADPFETTPRCMVVWVLVTPCVRGFS